MAASTAAIAAIAWLIASAAGAQTSASSAASSLDPAWYGNVSAVHRAANTDDPPLLLLSEGGSSTGFRVVMSGVGLGMYPLMESTGLHVARRAGFFDANGDLSAKGGAFAYAGLRHASPLATPAIVIQRNAALETPALLSLAHWLDTTPVDARRVAIGYTWRALRLEGQAVSVREVESAPARRGVPKFNSRSARLSFSPGENWIVRLSRGELSSLDHLVPGEDVRRTVLSATYRHPANGDWQTTVAWGRNSRRFHESVTGYLLESTLRLNGVHVLFGRFEQVGSDELARENESLQRQLFKMNKLTVGYFQDLYITSSLKLDIGAFVSRHFVPSAMEPSYGSGQMAYMMFVRVKLQ